MLVIQRTSRALEIVRAYDSKALPEAEEAQWACANCGEEVDGNFFACWSYGAFRSRSDRGR